MSLLVRDNRIEIPWLRDGAPNNGALTALTMTGASGYFTEPIDIGTFAEGIIFLLTAAHGGTNPTLDVNIQYSPDKINWIDSGDAVAQVTTTDGLFIKKLTTNFGKYVRFRLVIGGTANPTYKVSLWLALKG